MTTVTVHLDPICPWTWRASRWLATAVHEARTPISAALVADVAARSDVGSPVLVVEGAERGLHGPILDGVPDPAAGGRR